MFATSSAEPSCGIKKVIFEIIQTFGGHKQHLYTTLHKHIPQIKNYLMYSEQVIEDSLQFIFFYSIVLEKQIGFKHHLSSIEWCFQNKHCYKKCLYHKASTTQQICFHLIL